jgi:hypothetical protein
MPKNLPKPYLYKEKWLIFPDTAFTKLDILDCDDTIWGMCVEDVSLDQCIEQCNKFSKYCTAGYHVKTKSGKTLCAPLRTEIYPDLNPVSIIQHKDAYPEFIDAKVSTFINAKVHPFPRNQANTVFYKDIMNLINVETNTSIDSSEESLKNGLPIVFNKGERLNITFFPDDINSLNVAPYVPVIYGDFVHINVANSALVMKKDDVTQEVIWSQSLGVETTDLAFRILPISRGKIGEPVAYGDKIMFTYATEGIYLIVDLYAGNTLVFHSGDYERLRSLDTYYPTFTLESKMMGYYCDNGECKSVPISKFDVDGVSATYKGSRAMRMKGCYGMCSYAPTGEFSLSSSPHEGKSKKSKMIKIALIVILIMIIVMIIRRVLIYRGYR